MLFPGFGCQEDIIHKVMYSWQLDGLQELSHHAGENARCVTESEGEYCELIVSIQCAEG